MGRGYGVIRFEECGLAICELLETSEGGALPAAHILQELGLSKADYRKLLEYLSSEGPVSQARPRNPADMWGMQKTRSFYAWWEEKKQKHLRLSFDSKRLARTLLESKPDLTKLRRPCERLGWEYGERYGIAAVELIQEGTAEEDRVSDQDRQSEHLVLTRYGAQVIRRDFRLGPGGLARAGVGTWTGEGPRQDPGMRGHVVVSYSRQDEAYTRELVDDLQERGFVDGGSPDGVLQIRRLLDGGAS
jgi:hypothetical protein